MTLSKMVLAIMCLGFGLYVVHYAEGVGVHEFEYKLLGICILAVGLVIHIKCFLK